MGVTLVCFVVFNVCLNLIFRLLITCCDAILFLGELICISIKVFYYILFWFLALVATPACLYMMLCNILSLSSLALFYIFLTVVALCYGILWLSIFNIIYLPIYLIFNINLMDLSLSVCPIDISLLNFNLEFADTFVVQASGISTSSAYLSPATHSLSTEYIPWHETSSMLESLETLKTIYSYYTQDENSQISQFIKDNCEFLLNWDRFYNSTTQVPINIFTPDYWSDKPYLSLNFESLSSSRGKAGVYAFYIPELDKYYVGSALNLNSRLHTHYADVGKSERWHSEFYADVFRIGMDNVKYTILAQVPNYYNVLASEYPSTLECVDVLDRNKLYQACKFFSQFESYSIEQAVQSYLHRDISYHSTNVKFPKTWPSGNLLGISGQSRPIVVEFVNGETLNMPSIKQASRELGINSFNINSALNHKDVFKNCLYAPRARFYEIGVSPLESSPWPSMARGRRPDHPMIDFKMLSYNIVYVIDSNYTVFDTFESVDSARQNAGLGLHSKAVRSNINTNFVKCPNWNNQEYLFAQNPKSIGVKIPMISINQVNGIETYHDSVKDIPKDLSLGNVFNLVAFKTALYSGAVYSFSRSKHHIDKYIFMPYSKRHPINPLPKGTYVGKTFITSKST